MSRVPILTPAEADAAYASAQCVVEAHRRLTCFVRVGQTLAQIDAEVGRILASLSCRSAFFRYRQGRRPPFPSQSCLSVNECIVHGTAAFNLDPLKSGDLLSIDIGVVHKGWIGDAAWTYAIKEASSEAQRLMRCGREALRRGIPCLKPGAPYVDWARAVQICVESESGFHCVRGLGGHGYFRDDLHRPPYIANVVSDPRSPWAEAMQRWQPGNLVAVEPMISAGTGDTSDDPSSWPILTADRSLSVHYEADVLITSSGPRDLTQGMQDLPDVLG